MKKRKGGILTNRTFIFLVVFIISTFTILNSAFSSGPFGPPEPLTPGLHTAFGYWRSEDRYENGSDYNFTQNRIYSEAGYGSRNWEIYGRLGLADLKIQDAYRTSAAGVTVSRNDFQDNWSVFGTLGGKLFIAANETFGIGSFAQATWSGDFNDSVSGAVGGIPAAANVKVVNPWNVALGMAVQAKIPYGARLYAGPFLSYAEAKISPSGSIGGVGFTGSEFTLRNKSLFGGYAGLDLPLYKSFRLNVETQYSERWSAGAAISLIY